MMWKGKELDNGVGEGLAEQMDQWTIDSEGLSFGFAAYQAAAHAAGLPSATLTWQELRPYLNPAFHPEILPNPRPTPPADEAP